MVNAYDGDGNLTYLKRFGTNGNVIDNFNYSYYNSSDKVKRISSDHYDQFAYDNNGNVTIDSTSNIFWVPV